MKILKKISTVVISVGLFANVAFAASNTSTAKKSGSSGGVKTVSRTAPSNPSDVQFAEKIGDTLTNGTMEDALSLFNSYETTDSGLLALKSSLLLSSGNTKEADKIASELLKAEPNNVDVLELNMMIAKQKGDAVKKNQHLRKIIQLDPKNCNANTELGDEQSLKKNYASALKYYRTAWETEPNNTTVMFGCGKMNYYLSKDKDAKNYFNRILKIDSTNAPALSYLGKIEGENKRYKAAYDYVTKAIESDPNNSDYYLDLGTFSRFLGRYDEAEAAWKKSTELDPDYFLAHAYLAGLYDEQGRDDEAYDAYVRVVKRNPSYYYAYESIGMHAWRKGDYELSRKAFEEAAKKNPDNISYPLMATACYLKQKNVLKAKEYSDSVLRKISDKSSLDYKMLRMYHDQLGDADVVLAVQKAGNNAEKGNITSKNGKYLYYLALYYDMRGDSSLAQKYYVEICAIQSPMFFEYKLAQWAKNDTSDDTIREVNK